jgi:hypothetical protein
VCACCKACTLAKLLEGTRSNFLPTAAGGARRFTPRQVEEVKLVLRLLPIFATTMLYWTIYMQARRGRVAYKQRIKTQNEQGEPGSRGGPLLLPWHLRRLSCPSCRPSAAAQVSCCCKVPTHAFAAGQGCPLCSTPGHSRPCSMRALMS